MIGAGVRALRSLAAAVRRHGPFEVTRFGLGMVRRRGLIGAVRAAADRSNRTGLEAHSAEGAARRLDSAFSLGQPAWQAWMEQRRPDLAALSLDPAQLPAPLSLVFVVAPGDPDQEQATRDSVARLGPEGLDGSPIVTRSLDDSQVQNAAPDAFIIFVEAGDRIDAQLPLALARAARRGRAEVITFDRFSQDDGQVQPVFLPGANPTFARALDHTASRLAMRRRALTLSPSEGASSPHDRLVHWLDSERPDQVRGRWRHVAEPLIEVISAKFTVRRRNGPNTPPSGAVSVVICSKDKGHLLRQLTRSLLAIPAHLVEDITVVANNTTSGHALSFLEELETQPRVRVLRQDEPFNFSKLSNYGARESRGDYLLFLNDDIVPVTQDWLETLLAPMADPAVGATGSLLLYPDETVQHAGMYVGYRGSAGHTLRGARLSDPDPFGMLRAPREVSALTGAVLLTRRSLFEPLQGFDERLATYLQDVDYTLRVRRAGFVNVFEPRSILIHMESASILDLPTAPTQIRREREHAWFVERWGEALAHDDLHPAELDLQDESLKTLAPPRA